MAGITWEALLLAIWLLHLNFRVEGALLKLEKPVKHDYTIELTKVEVVSPGKHCVDSSTRFYDSLYNDTTRILNADMFVNEDFPEDSLMNVYVYKFETKSNKWLEAVKRSDPFCDYLGESSTLIDGIFTHGNYTHGCPLKKGYYIIRNYMQPADEFPLHLDEGTWRLDIVLMTKDGKETLLGLAITAFIQPFEDDD